MTDQNRYSIVFSDKFERLLREIIKADDISKAEAIRRSVAVYAYLIKELSNGHTRLQLINDADNTVKEIVLYASLSGEPRRSGSGRKPQKIGEPAQPVSMLSEQLV
jgi:hypothetical protein